MLHIRNVLRFNFICVRLQQKGSQVRECCNIGNLEPLRRIHALGQHFDVQSFTYHILCTTAQLVDNIREVLIALARDKDLLFDLNRWRLSFTDDIPTSRTHASTVAHRAARSFSIPQILTSSNLQARGSGSSNDRVATKLLRYENSVVESSPEAHASARCVGAPADPQRMLERHDRDNAAPIAAFRT